MIYELEIDPRALKEWNKLPGNIKEQFKSKLTEILKNPKIEANKLRNLKDCYKIKLRSSGYRLVYKVKDKELTILLIAIGKRENSKVYNKANERV